jgi:hypothetical protein
VVAVASTVDSVEVPIEEKKAREEENLTPDRLESAIDCIRQKEKNKLKASMKILSQNTTAKKISRANFLEISEAFKSWMNEEKTGSSFTMIAKLFHNWMEKVDMVSKILRAKFSEVIISILEHPEVLLDLDRQRVMKRLLVLIITKISAEQFVAYWSSNLLTRKTKINSEILIEWLTDWSRKGNTADKQIWEKFIGRFIPSSTYVTNTTAQSCHVAWKETIERPEKKEVDTMIVWNGNGMRAR